jgi:MoaA/NifB/PqqE/SkfB family radical SAM enzyme
LTPIVGDALIDPKFLERVRYLRSLPEIDRIWLTTNCILLDRFGIEAILQSGVSAINVSTAGFDAEMYERVYRNGSYNRMRRNVLELVERNTAMGSPVAVAIAQRPDRPLEAVMADPDFQPILAHKPELDFTWSFTSANGRITREILPARMKLRVVTERTEVGNILHSSLEEIWRGSRIRDLRSSFGTAKLNSTCAGCDMYRNLEFYRTRQGRKRAALNLARKDGKVLKSAASAKRAFTGG